MVTLPSAWRWSLQYRLVPRRRQVFYFNPWQFLGKKGLFNKNLRWDRTKGVLAEPHTNVLFDAMPIIWFKPVRKDQMTDRGDYECPIYKTSERKGTLSTTGHSTNFVLFLKLPSSKKNYTWKTYFGQFISLIVTYINKNFRSTSEPLGETWSVLIVFARWLKHSSLTSKNC